MPSVRVLKTLCVAWMNRYVQLWENHKTLNTFVLRVFSDWAVWTRVHFLYTAFMIRWSIRSQSLHGVQKVHSTSNPNYSPRKKKFQYERFLYFSSLAQCHDIHLLFSCGSKCCGYLNGNILFTCAQLLWLFTFQPNIFIYLPQKYV